MKTTPRAEAVPPFVIAIIDLLDCYHYADFVSEDRYSWIGWQPYAQYLDLDVVIGMSDRLFWALNPKATTQQEWYKWDAGFDVRIYDKNHQCVYKAHERLPKTNEVPKGLENYPKNIERLKKLKEMQAKIIKKMGELWQKEIDNRQKNE